jgi:hypothetical protein
MTIVSRNVRLITVNGVQVEFASYPEHEAWYEYGTRGIIGSLMAPMLANGEPDRDNVCEIEVEYGGADCPTCSDYVLDQDGTCAKCGSVPSIQY